MENKMNIIPPVDRSLLKAELTKERLLRQTNKGQNEIYIVNANETPSVMREIGRQRELAFRFYGGGTGLDCDIDEFDTMEKGYKQLIVWSPEDENIVGGYRFICGCEASFDEHGQPKLATSHMFNYSDQFLKEFLPQTVELGRSFVSLDYQMTRGVSKGIFILDNLWDGLGALTIIYPQTAYFFGKVTMFSSYDQQARNMILYFINKHFPDPDKLITPISPLVTHTDMEEMRKLFPHDSFKENFKILNTEVRKRGINVPPLVSAYMNLSPKMRAFGTAINNEFGHVEETGILIAVSEIIEEKRKRHIETFLDNNK